MKILLIDPPFYRLIGYYNRYFPLGLAYLASVLREDQHDVMIYDADCNVNPTKINFANLEDRYQDYLETIRDDDNIVWHDMMDKIEKHNPDVVGITVWTTFAASAFKLVSLVKRFDRNVPVVMGGPHVTIKCDEIMKICPDVDFLVRGEGESSFTQLVKALGQKWGDNKATYDDIRGISYRNNSEIIHNPASDFITDLDSLPFPARDLLLNEDSYDSEDMGILMTSRGCPYGCAYCATSIWERKLRYRSVDNIIREMKFVMSNYGSKQFTFKDDSFTVNKKRVYDFCDRLLKEGVNVNWDCNTRVDLVTEGLLRTMKKAGCNSIKVGIESGSERILKLMNKRITLAQSRNACKLFRKVGIHWTGYFMMGLPTETKEDMYKTLNFMKELKPDYASISVYEPFPGTELFEFGVRNDLVQSERSLDDFYNISPKYYYIKDSNRRVDTMSNDEFEKLELCMKAAFHKHNISFSRVLRRALSKSRVYLHEPSILWSDFRKFFALVFA